MISIFVPSPLVIACIFSAYERGALPSSLGFVSVDNRFSDKWSRGKMSYSPRSLQTSPLAPHLILSKPHTPIPPPSLAKQTMAPHEIRWGFISTGGIAQRFLAVRIFLSTCWVMGMRARADHDASATAGLALGPSRVRSSSLLLPSLASLTSESVHSQSLVAWQTRRRRRGPQGRRRRLPLASQSAGVRRLPSRRQRARGGEGVRVLRKALCGSCALSLLSWMASLIKMGSYLPFWCEGTTGSRRRLRRHAPPATFRQRPLSPPRPEKRSLRETLRAHGCSGSRASRVS